MSQYHSVTVSQKTKRDSKGVRRRRENIGRIVSWLVAWQVGSEIYWWQSRRENLLETSTKMETRYLQLADEVKLQSVGTVEITLECILHTSFAVQSALRDSEGQ